MARAGRLGPSMPFSGLGQPLISVHASTHASKSLQVGRRGRRRTSPAGVCQYQTSFQNASSSAWKIVAVVRELTASAHAFELPGASPNHSVDLDVHLGRHDVVHPLVHAVRVLRLRVDHPGVGPARRALRRLDRRRPARPASRPGAGSPDTATSCRRSTSPAAERVHLLRCSRPSTGRSIGFCCFSRSTAAVELGLVELRTGS